MALTEYSQLNTHIPVFQSFSGYLQHFVKAKLATGSIRVNLLITVMSFIRNVKNEVMNSPDFIVDVRSHLVQNERLGEISR